MARHIAAETGSYAAVYRVRTSTVCGHERCFNLGNFQIECVRHYGTTTMNATFAVVLWIRPLPGIYQFPPISEPVIDASSPPSSSLLPRIIDISRRSSRDLVLDYDMKFFTDGGTLSFSPLSIFLIPFPFLSPFSRTEITIMYWRSKMMKGRKI